MSSSPSQHLSQMSVPVGVQEDRDKLPKGEGAPPLNDGEQLQGLLIGGAFSPEGKRCCYVITLGTMELHISSSSNFSKTTVRGSCRIFS